MLKKNQDITLTIDGMTAEGSGVGHFDGQAVFVSNTAIGDEIACHIMVAKKTYAVGKIDKLLKASPDRVESDCDISERCGGCCYRHISYDAELKIKEQKVKDAFARIGHLDVKVNPIIGAKDTNGYRNKAQFPVEFDTRDGRPLIGFYAANTHRIVPCVDCKLQSATFSDVLKIVGDWLFDTHYKQIRHIYIREGHFTGEVMVCLVIKGDDIPNSEQLINELRAGIPRLKTVVLNINKKDTNVILGETCKVIYGDGYITDKLLGKTFRISPLSFFQVNSAQCEVLYGKALEYVNSANLLLDLYCGTGTIGLSMSDKAEELVGVEIIPDAISDAKKNAELNNITNAKFFCGDAKAVAERLHEQGLRPDVVLVDPPRKGLDESLPGIIAEMAPKRIVYVSCDPATLARDCARFSALGYAIAEVTPVDMFPHTAHVETVCLLSKLYEAKQPQCPEEKRKAIEEALKHFE